MNLRWTAYGPDWHRPCFSMIPTRVLSHRFWIMALFNFINRVSAAGSLKDAMDQSVIRHRQIADRVANATVVNKDGFAMPLGSTAAAAVSGERGVVDTEQEMAALANEQLYFETAATRLKGTYDSIRRALQDR